MRHPESRNNAEVNPRSANKGRTNSAGNELAMPTSWPLTESLDYKSTAPKLVLEPVRSHDRVGTYPLATGRFLIGAGVDCDIVIAIPGVAEQHCLMIIGANRTIVKALSPLTWINDGPLTEAVLRHGERLILGPVELRTRRPEVSEWIETPDAIPTAVTCPSTPVALEQSHIDELLDHAQLNMQSLLQEPEPATCLVQEIDQDAVVEPGGIGQWPGQARPVPAHLVEKHSPPSDETQTAASALEALRIDLESREALLFERQSRLSEEQLRLAALQVQLEQQHIELELKHAALIQGEECQAQQQQALEDEQGRVGRLNEFLKDKQLEVEQLVAAQQLQADLISQQEAELSLQKDGLRQESEQVQAAALMLRESTLGDPAEHTRRGEVLDRREALLSSSLAALQSSRDQITRESAQLEEKFSSLTARELQLQQLLLSLAEDRRRVENETRTYSTLRTEIEHREQALTRRERELSERESAVETLCTSAQSRGVDLATKQTEIDIQEEALNQQFSQLQLDRASLRASQAKIQLMEQESRQRIADLESSIAQRSQQIESTLGEERLRFESELSGEWDRKSRELVEQAAAQEQREELLNQKLQCLAEQNQHLESLRSELEVHSSELQAAQVQLEQEREEIAHERSELQRFHAEIGHPEWGGIQSTTTSIHTIPVSSAEWDELKALRGQLEVDRSALILEKQSLIEERERLHIERLEPLTVVSPLSENTTVEQQVSEQHDALGNERAALIAQHKLLEQQQQALLAEYEQAALLRAQIEFDHEQILAIRQEAASERDIYLLERQELISEKHLLADRTREIEKTEAQSFQLKTQAEREREDLAFERRQLDQQKANLEVEWNELRENRVALDKSQAELDTSRAELTVLATQLAELQQATAANMTTDQVNEPKQPSTSHGVDRWQGDNDQAQPRTERTCDVEQGMTNIRSSMTHPGFDQSEVTLDDSEEVVNDVPDPLAGFASFSAIDNKKDEILPPEIADIICRMGGQPAGGLMTGHPTQTTRLSHENALTPPEHLHSADDDSSSLPMSSSWRPSSSSTVRDEQRLRDLLRRSSESFVEKVFVAPEDESTVGEQQAGQHNETGTNWSDVDQEALPDHENVHGLPLDVLNVNENADLSNGGSLMGQYEELGEEDDPAPSTPVSEDSNALALRSRLSEMFGIDLSHLRQAGPATEPVVSSTSDQRGYSSEFSEQHSTPTAPIQFPAERELSAQQSRSADQQPHSQSHPLPTEEEHGHESLDPVAAYMEQLLARTRRSKDSTPAPPPPPPPATSITVPVPPPLDDVEDDETIAESIPVVSVPSTPVVKNRDGEKAAKEQIRANLDSFRSIANSRARSDVARSEFRRLSLTVNIKQIFLMLSGGIALILLSTEVWSTTKYRMESLAAIIATAFLGFDFFRTQKRMKELSELSPMDSETPEAAEETDENSSHGSKDHSLVS